MEEPALKTCHDLEWGRLEEAVGLRLKGTRAESFRLPVASTFEGTRIALAETGEASTQLAAGEPLPLEGIQELGDSVARLSREGALGGPALRDIRRTLGAARVLRRYLSQRRVAMPALHRICAIDPSLDALEDELGAHIESDGTLSDHASPELRRLRTETANLRARLIARLEEMIHKRGAILSDAFYTIRDGRYVLPVRRDAHERLQGIVHGTSSSGATVFVEPRALVTNGNRLTMALSELEREEARILAFLSESVRDRLPELEAAIDALAHADLRSASAILGRDLGAHIVPLAEGNTVDLKTARHPLLLLDGVDVVPNDLQLAGGHGLVLSGPNAGGKTVALKTLGLAALMMRAGLPLPVEEGSRCGFFAPILTDVGDDQSLTKNLSTFSAHITNIAGILERAGEGALILLDELAGGTDPEEGAALACAIVDALCRRGAAISVTTHYEPLKALAARDERLRNAAVGFDVEAMLPTFELTLDVPGASSALAVARRFGISEEVVAMARDVLPEQSRTFDELVRGLDAQRQDLVMSRAKLEEELAHARGLRADAEAKLAALEVQSQRKLSREAEKLMENVRRARVELKEARGAIRKSKDEREIGNARQTLEAAARVVAELRSRTEGSDAAGDGRPGVDVDSVRVGESYFVRHLKRDARVIEGPTRDKVRVEAGALKLWVEVSDLRPRAATARTGAVPVVPQRPVTSERARVSTRSADNTLDVRGLRVDEALAMTESFLDQVYGASESAAYIVHGVGSGALRDSIRELLARDKSYFRSFRSGESDEGGDRITVVSLR